MLITFFSFVMGIYGNLVLGPSVEQWRTFGQSMRNLVPMLRRPDAFSFEAAQAVDDTALAVYAPPPPHTHPTPTLHPPTHLPCLRLGRYQGCLGLPLYPALPRPRQARAHVSSCAHAHAHALHMHRMHTVPVGASTPSRASSSSAPCSPTRSCCSTSRAPW